MTFAKPWAVCSLLLWVPPLYGTLGAIELHHTHGARSAGKSGRQGPGAFLCGLGPTFQWSLLG